ncbi:CIC11C00000001011 [Sungouiella intermedia]|uniref:CIC11C00000001011 n=1 Tax=Sungouiella intermedia TaxID=45354 RepID=A0A1L0GJC6_9ASCO|nr:CIC11C00000001011 [[Candida] intermedia]
MITAIIIFLVIAYFVKSIVSDIRSSPLPAHSVEPPVQTRFVPATLAKFNGRSDPKVYIGVKGVVYDVSSGKSFYGPGGPYENFAGRDASRGLALNSFDPEVLTPIDQPLDTLTSLSAEEKESLDNWESHFDGKYKVVGTLHNPEDLAKLEAKEKQ